MANKTYNVRKTEYVDRDMTRYELVKALGGNAWSAAASPKFAIGDIVTFKHVTIEFDVDSNGNRVMPVKKTIDVTSIIIGVAIDEMKMEFRYTIRYFDLNQSGAVTTTEYYETHLSLC